jgi:hypothetical protein
LNPVQNPLTPVTIPHSMLTLHAQPPACHIHANILARTHDHVTRPTHLLSTAPCTCPYPMQLPGSINSAAAVSNILLTFCPQPPALVHHIQGQLLILSSHKGEQCKSLQRRRADLYAKDTASIMRPRVRLGACQLCVLIAHHPATHMLSGGCRQQELPQAARVPSTPVCTRAQVCFSDNSATFPGAVQCLSTSRTHLWWVVCARRPHKIILGLSQNAAAGEATQKGPK